MKKMFGRGTPLSVLDITVSPLVKGNTTLPGTVMDGWMDG